MAKPKDHKITDRDAARGDAANSPLPTDTELEEFALKIRDGLIAIVNRLGDGAGNARRRYSFDELSLGRGRAVVERTGFYGK
ncbi:MAG: hypothetical protein AAFY56_20500, partial [Pseudomonadota bacterium]